MKSATEKGRGLLCLLPAIVTTVLMFPSGTALAATPDRSGKCCRVLVRKGDRLFSRRDRSGNAGKALRIYEKAWTRHPRCWKAAWRTARAAAWLGEKCPTKTCRRLYGAKALKASKASVSLRPGEAASWFYHALALGLYARGISVFRAMFIGVKGKFQHRLEKAAALDSSFYYSAPLRVLGRFYSRLPAIAGRDYSKSERYLRRALAAHPKKIRTYYYLADTLWEMGKKKEALRTARECLRLDPAKEDRADGLDAGRACRRWLKKHKT